jgi:hypothetical protein
MRALTNSEGAHAKFLVWRDNENASFDWVKMHGLPTMIVELVGAIYVHRFKDIGGIRESDTEIGSNVSLLIEDQVTAPGSANIHKMSVTKFGILDHDQDDSARTSQVFQRF